MLFATGKPVPSAKYASLINDPSLYALGAIAFLMVGFSKAGFGTGIGSLAVPLMALIMPVPQASAIILPALLLTDIMTLWVYRKRGDWAHLRIMLPGAMVGTVIGYLAFRYLSDDAIRLGLGLIAVGLSVNIWYRTWRRRGAPPATEGPSWLKGGFWSVVSATTSVVANAGGPAIAVYLLPLRLDKTVFAATTTIYFAAVNYLKILPYWALGQFTVDNLTTTAVLLPAIALGMAAGFWLHHRLNDRQFYSWFCVLLFITGLKLLWDGATGVLARGAAL